MDTMMWKDYTTKREDLEKEINSILETLDLMRNALLVFQRTEQYSGEKKYSETTILIRTILINLLAEMADKIDKFVSLMIRVKWQGTRE